MSFSIESVESGVKTAFSGKRKWLWIGGIGVVVLVLFLKARNKASSESAGTLYYSGYPQTSDYASGGSTGTTSGGVTSDDIALLRDSFTESLTDAIDNVNAKIENVQNSQVTGAQTFADALNQVSSNFGTALDGVNARIAGVDGRVDSTLYQFNEMRAQQALQPPIETHTATAVNSNPVVSYSPPQAYAPAQPNYSPSLPKTQAPTVTTATKVSKPISSLTSSNQVTYLGNTKQEAKASGNTGLQKWANNQLYYNTILSDPSSNAGQKKWAEAQLKKGAG